MFRHVGRRLAILNTLIVIALVAIIGILTYGALRRNLQREIDQSLRDRIATVSPGSLSGVGAGQPVLVLFEDDEEDDDDDDDHEEEDDEYEEDREIVSSGDTVLLLIDRDGRIIGNPRDINLDDVPVASGVERALAGDVDVRSVRLSDDAHMRVMTAPMLDDGVITGAVQALRSLDEHEEQLEIVRNMTILGVGLGIVIAGPAGYFLSRRAMVPINTAFGRQRAFVADASHELRTPLTLIRAHAEYAGRGPERTVAEIQPSLDSIVSEVDRVSSMVTDLLTLARLDADRLGLDRSRQDLVALVRAAVESMRPIADRAGVSLEFAATDSLTADVDGARIEQVVRILLDNALSHTPHGGAVVVDVDAAGHWRQVTVRDTGSGISNEELPYVFERFSRPDSARDREHGGVGLGLAIAKGLVEAHGGSINIASALDEGTTVTVRLPE